MFCPECGVDHHAEEREARENVTQLELEIARVQAKRDVELARISAGVMKDDAVQEAEVVVAEAEGFEAGIEAGVEAATEPEVVEAVPEPIPIVVEGGPEPEPPAAPPPPGVEETPEVVEEEKKAGYWDYYR